MPRPDQDSQRQASKDEVLIALHYKVIKSVPAFERINRHPNGQKNLRNREQLFKIIGVHHHDQ